MLKNLKSLFIVDDESGAAAGKPAPPSAARNKDAPEPLSDQRTGGGSNPGPRPAPQPARFPERAEGQQSTALQPRSGVSSTNGEINTAIVAKLLDGVDRNDLEGFDYLEYKRSLKAMESLPMDEATKYRSAFATASTVGATQEKLLGSIDYYLQTLDQEKSQFDGVVERQFQDQVAGRKAKLEQLRGRIAEKAEQIKALEAEIGKHEAEAQDIARTVGDSETKIENTRRDFDASFAYVKNLFVQDAEKMRRYLK